jgi:hypothetical protein
MGPIDLVPDIPVPWRPPSLRQLRRRTVFQDAHSSAARWLDQRFAHAEQNLPWLKRADGIVSEYCWAGAPMFTHTLRRDRKLKLCYGPQPPVTCLRQVTIAYGFGGPLPDNLAGLAGALDDDGWSWMDRWNWRPQEITRAWLAAAGREASLSARWHHRPGLEPPPLLWDTVPELRRWHEPTPSLSLAWTSQGEPGQELQRLPHQRPRGSWPCRPVTYISRPDRESITSLAATVLASHEHAVVISIHAMYYQNEDARTGPGRLRKLWLPVMW